MAVAGVVCEGHSDFAILSEVIYELWPETDQILLLQPILDSLGHAQGASGASGVQAWCGQHRDQLAYMIDPDVGPRLDLLVIALDADAAIDAGGLGHRREVSAAGEPRTHRSTRTSPRDEEAPLARYKAETKPQGGQATRHVSQARGRGGIEVVASHKAVWRGEALRAQDPAGQGT